jgi:HlyD family secretion protein
MTRRLVRGLVAGLVTGVLALGAAGCTRKASPAAALTTAPVERRDIRVTIEATGTVEPVDLVEVKSKASGQILDMPVEIGSQVAKGQLLAQVDMVDVRNAYAQAEAALQAARTRGDVAAAQRKRSDDLFDAAIITAQEHDTALLDDATAKSQLVSARADLDVARQRRDDATVRAPIAGTILSQPVAVGQVISSGTSSVSGGTVLLTMADLSQIRVRALVIETDIGQVHPDQPATVTIESFPNRPFPGRVAKIEPQAVVQQSVTMFPVLVAIENREGLLLPGMNGEIVLVVDERRDVLAVPADAVRPAREAVTVAGTLGIDPDSLRARSGGSRADRGQVVFVRANGRLEVRSIRVGLNDFDYVEILSGVREGEEVVLVGVAEAQSRRAEDQQRLRQRMGSGMPGQPGGNTGGRGTGGTGRRTGG